MRTVILQTRAFKLVKDTFQGDTISVIRDRRAFDPVTEEPRNLSLRDAIAEIARDLRTVKSLIRELGV